MVVPGVFPQEVKIPPPYSQSIDLGVPQVQTFPYTLRGTNGAISFTVYSGANAYFASKNPSNVSDEGEVQEIVGDYRQDLLLQDLVSKIKAASDNPDDQARIAISLVQHIPYNTAGAEKNGQGEWIRHYYPYEVLYNNKGQCQEKSQLLAYLLKELGYSTVIFEFPSNTHAAVGIRSPLQYSFRSTGYAFVESTTPWIITDESGSIGGTQVKNLPNPEILPISDGKSMDTLSEEWNDAQRFDSIPAKIQTPSQSLSNNSNADSLIFSLPNWLKSSWITNQYSPPDQYTETYNPEYVKLADKYGINYANTDSGATSPDNTGKNLELYTTITSSNALIGQKKYSEALNEINNALAQYPDDLPLLKQKIIVEVLLGDNENALASITTLLQQDPQNRDAYYLRGWVLNQTNDDNGAIAAFNAAIQVYPEDVASMFQKGNAYFAEHQYQDALESYNEALAINPDYADIWTGKGEVLTQQGNIPDAIVAYKNALSANPGLPSVWSQLGNLYAQQGQCGIASSCYRKATALDNTTAVPSCVPSFFLIMLGIGSLIGIALWGYAVHRSGKTE